MFVDAAAMDYRLRPGSPLIDAGRDPATLGIFVGADCEGEPLPHIMGWDIGLDEW